MKIKAKVVVCAIVLAVCATALVACTIAGCSGKSAEIVELRSYPVNAQAGEVLTKTGVEFDGQITSDGDGSLRLTASRPSVFRLYETGDIDTENSRLIYQARVKTADVNGEVYLEMWCHFPGKGEFFSRALHAPVSGTVEWTSQETPFFLKKGENPDNVKLNVVVNGTGTVWIDDIRLLKAPL